LHRCWNAVNRVFPIEKYALLGLAACGAFWLCALQFHKMEDLRRRYGQLMPRMVWSIVANIARSGGSLPGRNQQIYLSQLPNAFSTDIHNGSWLGLSCAPLLLFMANTLKIAGMFDLASITYRLVEDAGFEIDMALAGLGDLYLVEAGWSEEVQAHFAAGILLDPHLAPCLKVLTPAWTMRPFSDSIVVLRKATSNNPGNRLAWWLLVCALLKAREWDDALASLRRYLELAAPLYEQNTAEAVAEYGRDRIRGYLLLQRNIGRWLGWLKVTNVQIVDGPAARSIEGIEQIKLAEGATLTLKCHVISGGEMSYYERDHVFSEILAYKIKEAEILPSYGATVALGQYLLKDTIHILPIHWHRYTPSLIAMTTEHALICREATPYLEIEDAIYFGHNASYYHFICEDLPRLLLFEEKNGRSNRALLVDQNIGLWQQRLLVQLGFDPLRWKAVNFSVPMRLPQLNVPSLVSKDLLVHPKAVDLIRTRLALAGGNAEPRAGKRLYLSRNGGGSRNAQFLNEEAIARQLFKKGFVSVETGSMTMDEQIELFSDAEVVAGPGGAALTNLVFAPRGCAALVLASNSDAGETFSSLTSSIGQDYFVCIGDGYPRPRSSWIHTNFDFSIDPNDVSLALEKIFDRRRDVSS